MKQINDLKSYLNQNQPALPVHIYRLESLTKMANQFLSQFPGETCYAIKANPHPDVLKTLFKAGIKKVDVASIEEIKQVKKIDATIEIFYMNPIKSKEAIREAYYTYGVRTFALDSTAELDKILMATDMAQDLTLFCRLAVPNKSAQLDLYGKFGISDQEAPDLLNKIKPFANKVGICFHIGSQCLDPQDFNFGIHYVLDCLKSISFSLDYLDIGGGFPINYPGMSAPPLPTYFKVIEEALKNTPLEQTTLICEPGRALVAECMSLLVRVEHRKNNTLYINDGIYGTLFDAGTFGFKYPIKSLSKPHDTTTSFNLYGPTCDSYDAIKGPFELPHNTETGDYIQFDLLGAYGSVFQTSFNGYHPHLEVKLTSKPQQKVTLKTSNKEAIFL